MFYCCDYLPDSLNLPQEITTVGNVFCSSMFFSFYGTNLPDGFNLPPNINKIGKNFCAFMLFHISLFLIFNVYLIHT